MLRSWGLESLFIGPLLPTGPSDGTTGEVIRASFAKNRSHSRQFNLKAKRGKKYKSFVISTTTKGPTFYKERLAPERARSIAAQRKALLPEVRTRGRQEGGQGHLRGRCLSAVPTPSGKRVPLGLDAEGFLFIFILVLLVVAAAVATAVTLHAVVFASSIGTEDLHGERLVQIGRASCRERVYVLV